LHDNNKALFGTAHNSFMICCELFFCQTLIFKIALWVKLFFLSSHKNISWMKLKKVAYYSSLSLISLSTMHKVVCEAILPNTFSKIALLHLESHSWSYFFFKKKTALLVKLSCAKQALTHTMAHFIVLNFSSWDVCFVKQWVLPLSPLSLSLLRIIKKSYVALHETKASDIANIHVKFSVACSTKMRCCTIWKDMYPCILTSTPRLF